jgi:hypothetical protein
MELFRLYRDDGELPLDLRKEFQDLSAKYRL